MNQITLGMDRPMTSGSKRAGKLLVLLMAAGFATLPARAGAMELSWDPVAPPDLAGYRIYYDTPPAGGFGSFMDIGRFTSYTLAGLQDCAPYHVAIKARDAQGVLSAEFSNEITGYPHPEIASVTPASVQGGQTLEVTINGVNFLPGAQAQLTNVTVNSSRVDSCGRMTVQITVPAGGGLSSDLTVVNSDGGLQVLRGALQIAASSASLAIVSTSPAAGLEHIDAQAEIRVQFNKPLNPATVNAGRFRILKSGRPIAMRAGFPTVDPTGTIVTLQPAAMLEAGATYALQVIGGPKGVLAADKQKLPASFVQSPGFKTEPLLEGAFFAPDTTLLVTPALQALAPGVEVPVTSSFSIRFSEVLNLLPVSAANFRILAGRRLIPLAAGSPSLSSDGLSVTLDPASPLPAGTSFKIIIIGGPRGVRSTRGVTMSSPSTVFPFTTSASTVTGLGIAD